MSARSVPGPDGLRCDLPAGHDAPPIFDRIHSRDLGGPCVALWWRDDARAVLSPLPVGDGLRALGAVLREHGEALSAIGEAWELRTWGLS